MIRWYAARVHPNKEKAAALWLRPRESFAPECLESRHDVTGRHYVARCMMFPSYIFLPLEFSMSDWAEVNRSEYVVGLMRGFGDRPQALPEGFIEAIQERMAWEGNPLPLDGVVAPGRPVPFYNDQLLRVTSGPYAGFTAIFQRSARKRVVVLLHIFGRPSRVSLPTARVEAA